MFMLRHARQLPLQRGVWRTLSSTGGALSGPEGYRVEVLNGAKGIALHDTSGEERQQPVELHALWLRERTQDEAQIFVGSGQRRFTVSKMFGTPSATVKEAVVKEDKLRVVYGDGYEDTLDLRTILAEVDDRYVLPTTFNGEKNTIISQRLPERKLWRDEAGNKLFSVDNARHDYNAMKDSEEGLYNFLSDLHTWGCALVENTPYDLDDYEAFLGSFGLVRPTNWGKWFEVFSNKARKREGGASSEDAAYSSDELPLHTDGPYNENPLHFQLLQCLKQSPIGGESQLADGYTAAKMMAQSSADLLSEVPVRFRYHDDVYEMLTERPVLSKIKCEGNDYYEIFFSERLDLTPVDDVLKMGEWFAAKQEFNDNLYHPSNLEEFKLKEGDMVVFDNRRVLHGRGYFDENAVAPSSPDLAEKEEMTLTVGSVDLSKVNRYLRGCYVEGVEMRLRALGRSRSRQFSTTTRAPGSVAPRPAFLSTSSTPIEVVGFTQLKDCTSEDMALVSELYTNATTGEKLGDRAMFLLKLLTTAGHEPMSGDTHLGLPVDLYEHSLQTATRCYEAGCSEDVIVAGLLHDLGELLSPSNHGEFSAALLRPFVEPKVSWMLDHHEVFQMYYYNDKMTPKQDIELRQMYKGADAFDFTVQFCEDFDQKSFDPSYSSRDLSFFEPMVHRVFKRDAYWHTPDHPKKGAVTG